MTTHRGFVNGHTHIYSALAPYGMPAPHRAPQNFTQILERVWWRLDRALDERAIVASARLYAAESLLRGATTLNDHHESPNLIEGSLDLLADACDAIGIRAVLTYGATERNFGRSEGERGLAECRRFILANRRPNVRALIGLHASFTVSDETVKECASLCQELGVPAHVHVAEDVADVRDARDRGHAGPLERLVELGALPAGSVMAHGVFLDAGQVRAAGAMGLWLVQNPRSNEGNHVGYPKHLSASTRVGLGTDGYLADMIEERTALDRLAKEFEPRLEANRRLVEERFGPGVFDRDEVEFDAGPAAPPLRARRVVVGGRTVVDGGRLLTADIDELRAQAVEAAPALWERMLAYAE